MLKTDEAIKRFGENEERVETFVNDYGHYTTNRIPSEQVETLPSLMERLKNHYLNIVSRGDWVTASMYAQNDVVTKDGYVYLCVIAHKAGTFSTDLSSGKWVLYQGATKRDIAELSAFGVSTANTPAQNTVGLNACIDYCLENGIEEIHVDKNYTFDSASISSKRSLVKFGGAGSISGVYRKQVSSEIYPTYVHVNEINPQIHLKNLGRTNSPTVVIMGDSISTEAADSYSITLGYWSILKDRFTACNPEKNFSFYNRAIGGQTWTQANGKPTSFPAWYSNTSLDWLDYIKNLSPDVLVLGFGMNDSNTFNASHLVSTITKIKSWTKVPDLIFVTNPVPALTTIYPDGVGTGFSQELYQEGRDYVAGFERTYARQKQYGLIDVNRALVAMRDGYDTKAGILKKIESVSATAYRATVSAKDFCFVGTVNGATWTEGKPLKIECGLDASDFIFINKTSGKFDISGYSASLGQYALFTPNIAIPNVNFILEVSVWGGTAKITYIPTGGDKIIIAEFPVIRHGGRFFPKIEWQATPSLGPFIDITYLSGYGEQKYSQCLTDKDIWGVSDSTSNIKPQFGGNGINHYCSKAYELLLRPVIEACDLRAPRLDISESDIILSANTTAVGIARAQKIGRFVHLTGTLKNTVATSGTAIFTVPSGFKPPRTEMRFGTPNDQLIKHIGNGVFILEVGSISALLTLDNINYYTDD